MFVALVASVAQEAATPESPAQVPWETTPEPLAARTPLIVPAPPRAAATVPEARLDAFSAVRLVPTPADGVPISPPWK